MDPQNGDTSGSLVHAAHDKGAAGLSPNTTGLSRADGNGESLSLNVVHQRRRVNPESLALRLGPDLVRDLDALITPGNTEMPSFAVRKELQERYSIDRRHIYDYFHSRGLRVVKEDKHGNPVTAKDLQPPLPNLRPLRQAPIKNTRSHPPYPVASERKSFESRGVTKAKPGRPKKKPGSSKPKIVSIVCEPNESTDTNASVSEHSSPPVVHPTYVTVNPLLPCNPLPPMSDEDAFNTVINPLDETFSVRRAIGDIAYAYRHKSVFERMQKLAEYPIKVDAPLSWNETSSCSASAEGLLLPHTNPLTRDERRAMYEALSDSIGPAQGIEECQGSYRKHMEARTKLYYEGVLPLPYHYTQPSTKMNTSSDRVVLSGTNEFRHWLSESRFLKRDVNDSPRLHPSSRNVNVAQHEGVDGVTDKQSMQRSSPLWLQTLDGLFPNLGDRLDKPDPLADSPIVHMQEITGTTTLGDRYGAGDRQPFSVMSSQGLPVLSATSVAEIRQTGHAQFHGYSGISGPQEVKTPVAVMDGRPQWSEHDPYVTHSGQHLGMSGRHRRGRNISSNSRNRLPSCSPRKHHIRDLDKTRTKPATARDARRRTTSAAGDI